MDRVFVRSLQVDALIGAYEHERRAVQPLLLDIDLACDNAVPAASDAVADAIDYAAVCAAVRDFVGQREPQLLETLAEALAAQLLSSFNAQAVRVRIDKPQAARALGCASVGVEIFRNRAP